MTVTELGRLDEEVVIGDPSTVESALRIAVGDPDRVLGQVELTFNPAPAPGLDATEAQLIALGIGLIAGQAALAPVIRFDFDLAPEVQGWAEQLAGLLYDAHAYGQQRHDWPVPSVQFAGVDGSKSRVASAGDRKRVVLLWSGGKDALLSLKVLRLNGFEVVGLHARANQEVADLEDAAARRLAAAHDLELVHLEMSWPLVADLLTAWSTSSSVFPLLNPVPHGRDLVLLMAAAVVARRSGSHFVAAGFEYDLWARTASYDGRTIYRHDVQSRRAGEMINGLLAATSGVRFFSPIAAFRERELMTHLLTTEPGAWEHIVSCFWGNWCGQCTKCLRYALTQAAAGSHLIKFKRDPFREDSLALAHLVDSLMDKDLPFWEQQVVNLYAVNDRGGFRDHPRVRGILETHAGWFEAHRVALQEALRERHPDDLAPPDFRWALE